MQERGAARRQNEREHTATRGRLTLVWRCELPTSRVMTIRTTLRIDGIHLLRTMTAMFEDLVDNYTTVLVWRGRPTPTTLVGVECVEEDNRGRRLHWSILL